MLIHIAWWVTFTWLLVQTAKADAEIKHSSCPFARMNTLRGDFSEVINALAKWGNAHKSSACEKVTQSFGNPVSSEEHSLTIAFQGGLAMDHVLLNNLQSLNREEIPQRLVHAKGHGAFGHFRVTNDVSQFTMARLFNAVGKETKMLVRFSNSLASRGESDTLPDVRGFALRFYTKEDGNLDFPGLQIPAFVLRDPMRFPHVIHALKKNPVTNRRDPLSTLDYASWRPEALNTYIRLHADNVLLGSSRAMNGYAVNTYTCVNSFGIRVYCKFSWISHQHIPNLSDKEAVTLAGTDPTYYSDDLYNSIATGEYPGWDFGLQVMTFEEAASWTFNPFDATKVWSHKDIPFIKIGEFYLDENPTNYFTQIEQAAFCPSLIPGIASSPDIILQARLFAYKDAHRHRLGTNFEEIEVNKPLGSVAGYRRDGPMRLSPSSNGNGGPSYFPNSFNGPAYFDPLAKISEGFGYFVQGHVSRTDNTDEDNFSQPREFLANEVSKEERRRIAFRIGMEMRSLPSKTVLDRMLNKCIAHLGHEFRQEVLAVLNSNNETLEY